MRYPSFVAFYYFLLNHKGLYTLSINSGFIFFKRNKKNKLFAIYKGKGTQRKRKKEKDTDRTKQRVYNCWTDGAN